MVSGRRNLGTHGLGQVKGGGGRGGQGSGSGSVVVGLLGVDGAPCQGRVLRESPCSWGVRSGEACEAPRGGREAHGHAPPCDTPQASLHAHTLEESHPCQVAAQQEGDLAETRMSEQRVGLSEEPGQGWCPSARSVLWEVGSLGLSREEAPQASLLSPCAVSDSESRDRARTCQERAWPHSSPGGHRGPGSRRQQVEKPWSSQGRGRWGWAGVVLPRRVGAKLHADAVGGGPPGCPVRSLGTALGAALPHPA